MLVHMELMSFKCKHQNAVYPTEDNIVKNAYLQKRRLYTISHGMISPVLELQQAIWL